MKIKVEALNAYTQKIKSLLTSSQKNLLINRHHIESERAYRGIHEADIQKTLQNGAVTDLRADTLTLIWQGRDGDGRTLELMLTMLDETKEETLETATSSFVRVGTAYDPSLNDKKVRHEWLKQNPDYEELPFDRGVRGYIKTS